MAEIKSHQERDSTSSRKKPIRWRQYYAAFAANLAAFSFGEVFAWTATGLPSLKAEGSLGEISRTQESWITSVIFIGALIASPLTGFLMERFGRRLSILLVSPFMVASWLLIAFAQNIPMMYVGRLLTGTCSGCLGALAPVYIAETSEKDIRGMLVCAFDPLAAAGVLFVYIVGSYTPWNIQALACIVAPVASHILLAFAPESPRYLIGKQKYDEAKIALEWFRSGNTTDEINSEFKEMTDYAEEIHNNKSQSSSTLKMLFRMDVLKPTLIGMGIFFFHQASGNYAIVAYLVDIFKSAGSQDEYMSSTIVGAAQMIGAFAPIFLVERCGRKFLLVLSESIAGLTLIILGIFFYLKSSYGDEFVQNHLSWLPLTSLFIHEIAYNIGIGPIPFLLMGELAPSKAKGISTSIMSITVRAMGFLVLYKFNDLMDVFGLDVGFWFLASMCLLGAIFIIIFVPETKGKTLEEIHSKFSKSKIIVEKL